MGVGVGLVWAVFEQPTGGSHRAVVGYLRGDRGGSFGFLARYVRSAYRSGTEPFEGYGAVGFRLEREAE
jgi:formylglycine-generating enzyme required for sulfatase activity